MKETLRKYGPYLFSLAGLSVLLSMPLAALAVEANLSQLGDTGLPDAVPLVQIIGAIIGTILAILGVLLVILILYAGFLWMTSQGDKDKLKKAKDIIIQSIIGLLIIFAAYAITNFVFSALTNVSEGDSYQQNG